MKWIRQSRYQTCTRLQASFFYLSWGPSRAVSRFISWFCLNNVERNSSRVPCSWKFASCKFHKKRGKEIQSSRLKEKMNKGVQRYIVRTIRRGQRLIREPEHEKRNFVFSRQEMFLARRKKTSNNSPFSFTLEKIATASHCLSFFVAAKNESRASRQRPRRRRENSLLSPLSGLGIGGLQKSLTGGRWPWSWSWAKAREEE